MDIFKRLETLVDSAAHDKCSQRSLSLQEFIHYARRPGGSCPILKVALTNSCERNCRYCAFRHERDSRRTRLAPEEMAAAFMEMFRRNMVEGLFLTSGLRGGPARSQDTILATAEILRKKYHYRGYLHLKVMPGADDAQIERAVELGTRVSVNLEATSAKRLAVLSPDKSFDNELSHGITRLRELTQGTGRRVSQSTQFVVGPAGESDREILDLTQDLYRNMRLARVYYSPFRPVPNTPLEGEPAEDPTRVHRLYQADFLIRDYGFSSSDLPVDGKGRLSLGIDPKQAWARLHPQHFPVDLASADYYELLLVPGIGPKTARKLLEHRARHGISSGTDLRSIGVIMKRARGFIAVKGKRARTQEIGSLF